MTMPEMTLDIDTSSGGMRMPYNKRGECSICGKPAYDGRATKCEEHRTKPKRPTNARTGGRASADPVTFVTSDAAGGGTVGANGDVIVEPPKPPDPTPLSPKGQKAASLKAQILTDINPQLVKGFALVCRPVPEANFYELSGSQMVIKDPLGKTPMFAEWEADVIAHCFVELESQPMVMMAGKAAGPVVPYLYMLGGIAVIAWHGYNCMMTRDRVLAQWERMQAEQRANFNREAGAQPMPPAPGESTSPTAEGPQMGEAQGTSIHTLDDEAIDAEIVESIPPANGNGSQPVEPGEFADFHAA